MSIGTLKSVIGSSMTALPWCCITPAAFAVSGLATAGAGTTLSSATPIFLVVSIIFLSPALYLALIKRHGAKWVRVAVLATAPMIALLSPTVATPQESGSVYNLQIDGLACSFCAYGVEKKLKNTEGVEVVDIKINDGLVFVTVEPGAKFDEEYVRQIIEEAGFTLRDFQKVEKRE